MSIIALILIVSVAIHALLYIMLRKAFEIIPKECNCTLDASQWKRPYIEAYLVAFTIVGMIMLALLWSDAPGAFVLIAMILSGAMLISTAIYIYAVVSMIDDWRSRGVCQCTSNMKNTQTLLYMFAIIKGVLYVEVMLIFLFIVSSVYKLRNSLASAFKRIKHGIKRK